MKAAPTTFAVDPARLGSGAWCHKREKTIGQGDISASYSADKIGMDQPVRKPFEWQGALWACVGCSGRGGIYEAEAYRLVHPSQFQGMATTYREKVRDADEARADPAGFYHGMAVKCAGGVLVLCGPPTRFIAGEERQLNLFV